MNVAGRMRGHRCCCDEGEGGGSRGHAAASRPTRHGYRAGGDEDDNLRRDGEVATYRIREGPASLDLRGRELRRL